MDQKIKIIKALRTLKSDAEYVITGSVATEEDFNNIDWVTGENNGQAITTKTNPHSEITWTKVKEEMDKL
jgi:hypothetical protein